ncbi:hypothetical protein DID78_06280, partial [Candidatus Marinamargulisbacteria bacterium SCGC AG-343-D04]
MKKNIQKLLSTLTLGLLVSSLISCGGKTSNLNEIATDSHSPYAGDSTLSFAINIDSALSSQIQTDSASGSNIATRVSGLNFSEGSNNTSSYTSCDGQVKAFNIDKGTFISLSIPVSIEGNNAKIYNVKSGETYSLSLSCPIDDEKSLQLQSLASIPQDSDSSEETVSEISETSAYKMAAFTESSKDLIEELKKIELSITQKMEEIASLLNKVSSTVETFINEQKVANPNSEDLFVDPIVKLSETADPDSFLNKVSQDLLSEESLITKIQESSDTAVSKLYIENQNINKNQSIFLLQNLTTSLKDGSYTSTAILNVFSDIMVNSKTLSLEILAEAAEASLLESKNTMLQYAVSSNKTLIGQLYNPSYNVPSEFNEDILKSIFSKEDSQLWTTSTSEELESIELSGIQAFSVIFTAFREVNKIASDETVIAFTQSLRSLVFGSDTQSISTENLESSTSNAYFETFTPKNGQYKFVMSGNSTMYKKVVVRNENDTTYIDTYFLEINESDK